MGVVYLASDPGGRPVAIKVLHQGLAADETARRRLAHEVATMRRVSSPYVAEVIDADVAGHPPYIVTRYVPGQTLESAVADGGPVLGAALARLASGLTAALAAVHSAGVVHRDLKPGNVMLVDGTPVVIDFGIAQAADSTRLTMTGMFMGTPGYLAPEVIEGRPSGPAADIHSWGATMAYAATGRPPFGTGTFEAIFYRIVHGQPDLDAMPAPLVPLVLAALARDPSRRPTAAELTDSVARLDPAALVPAPPGTAVARPAAGLGGGRTAPDLAWPAGAALPAAALPAVAAGAAAGGAGAAGAGAGAWPGTRELAARPGSESYADLLPPVRYEPPGVLAAAGPAAAGPYPVAGGAQRPPTLQPQSRSAAAAAQSRPARLPLVLATLAGLVAASILLPVAGAAVVLAALVTLRASDLTASWLARGRAGSDRSGRSAARAVIFFPWAVCRSVVRFVLLAPMALLCAAGAAAIAVLAAGPADLPRAGGWAAGALVACYCIGPGSAGCRRPISRFYGRVTKSPFGAAAGFIAVAAVAVVAITAAASRTPGYWPEPQLGHQLQAAAVHHPLLSQLPGSLGQVGRRLLSWMGHGL